MRTSAIIRIVTGAVVATLLTAILVAVLLGVNLPAFVRTLHNSGNISEALHGATSQTTPAESGAASGGTAVSERTALATEGITKIKIQWVAGSVRLVAGTGNEIAFSETASRALTDAQKMRYSVENGTLKISYCDETFGNWNWLDSERLNMPAKHLTVEIPAALNALSALDLELVSSALTAENLRADEIDIESISGRMALTGASCRSLEMQSVSGSMKLAACTARSLDVETVSGSVEAAGSFDEVDTDSVSGNVTVSSAVAPSKADLSAISGELTLNVPADAGFTLRYETVSGDVSCEMPATMKKGSIECGSGAASYSFETVSGDISVGTYQ